MEQNPWDKKQPAISLLIEVAPIRKTRGIAITSREQVKEVVEQPLVKACEAFWDKNIKTYESSANSESIKSGSCYIRIDFDSLSEENKEIAQQYGEPRDDVGVQVLELNIPVTGSETINDISDKALEIANAFQKQRATWIEGTTLQQHLQWLGERYGKYEGTAEEIERLQQSGVWEAESKRLGNYFDPETQTSWASKELYLKNKGSEDLE